MINLQLKSTQNETALADISSIIKAVGEHRSYKIRGHEIHQTKGIMDTTTLKERVEMVSRFCNRNELDYLSYHALILGRGHNIWEDTWKERVRKSLQLTMKEASKVKQEAGIPHDVLVVFHLTNYLHLDDLPKTMQEKLRVFEVAEREFLEFASKQLAEKCILTLENTYPRYDKDFANIGPFHPRELIRMKKYGIKSALDIAHFQLYANYMDSGSGNLMGDLDREEYKKAPSWTRCIKILGDSLALLHISDAKGFAPKGEALPLGRGEVPLLHVLREAGYGRTLQGTLELNGGHLDNGRPQLEAAKWLLQNVKDVFV